MICERFEMTQRGVDRKSGLTQANNCLLPNSLTLQLKSDALCRLAAALNSTVDYLVGKEELMKLHDVLKSDPGVRELIELYAMLGAEDKQCVVGWMRYLVSSNN